MFQSKSGISGKSEKSISSWNSDPETSHTVNEPIVYIQVHSHVKHK